MKKFIVFAIIFVFAFFFIACGGEEGPDNEGVDDAAIVDDTTDNEVPDSDIQDTETDDVVDSEPTDETPDDDVIDKEPNDDDISVSCKNNDECSKVCEVFLDREKNWANNDGDKIKVSLSVIDNLCNILVTGSKKWHWKGTSYPLEPMQGSSYLFYLQQTGPEIFAVDQKQEIEGPVLQTVTFFPEN